MSPPGSGWDVCSGREQCSTCRQLCVGKSRLFPATKDFVVGPRWRGDVGEIVGVLREAGSCPPAMQPQRVNRSRGAWRDRSHPLPNPGNPSVLIEH